MRNRAVLALAVAALLAGCTGNQGPGPGGDGGTDTGPAAETWAAPTVSIAWTRCEGGAETRGDGYAGPYTETTWLVSAGGSASGEVGARLFANYARAEPELDDYGHTLTTYTGGWLTNANGYGMARSPTDPATLAWTASEPYAHTDFDNVHTAEDDRQVFPLTVKAVISYAPPHEDTVSASDLQLVECR